jgi:ankyrin repeat protein
MAFNGNATKNMDIIKLLLEKGSNPNTCRNGRPLISLMPANLNMIDLLLNYGANPNLEDLPNKQTVLTKLIKDFTYATAESVVKRLLQDASIDLDRIQSDGKTYLMQAALQADGYHYIKSLLEAGADPTIVNVNGKTAKYCAINPDTAFQLLAAEEDWIKQVDEAVNNLLRKFMVIRRLKQSGLIERHLCEHIIRLSQYAELCQGPNSNLNKPGLIALARSLYINTTNRTKIELCNDISSKLI